MITNSRISMGDQLGAQLTTLAELIYIAKENNHELVFWNELRYYRRGYQFLDVFEITEVKLLTRCCKIVRKIVNIYSIRYKKLGSWKEQMNRIYNHKLYYYLDKVIYNLVKLSYIDFECLKGKQNGIHLDDELKDLKENANYDIIDGFGTYQDWKKYKSQIINSFCFKDEIIKEGDCFWNTLELTSPTVSIHFRRTDYLILSSLNLSDDYYKKAMDKFDKLQTKFIVFSDDIEECKSMELFQGIDVYYMPQHSAGVDLYLMSKCDNNIIANSTFSFWGAFLNKKEDKKVICPHDFIGKESAESIYINGNYYPEDWIAI